MKQSFKNIREECQFLKRQKFWSGNQKSGYYVYLNEAVFSFMTQRLDGENAFDSAKDLACVIRGGMHRLAEALGWDKKQLVFLNEVMKHLPSTIQAENRTKIKKRKSKPALAS